MRFYQYSILSGKFTLKCLLFTSASIYACAWLHLMKLTILSPAADWPEYAITTDLKI
jgi:hypothetical protein